MFKFIVAEPLWVMQIHLRPGQEVKPHAHEHYYHMIYVMNGCINIQINNTPYVLGENMMVIAKPGEVQSWKNERKFTTDTYEIKFSVLDKTFARQIASLPDIIYGNFFYRAIVEKILQAKERRGNYQEYTSLYLNTLLYDLVRMNAAEEMHEDDSNTRYNPAQIVIDYIEENYANDISLESIAEAIHFNKSYIATAFKQLEGITINEYIYKYRAYKACELIAYSDLRLGEVSAMTGFKHIQHFTRVFKKYIGIPPGEYRDAMPKHLTLAFDRPEYNTTVFAVRAGRTVEIDSDNGVFRSSDEKANEDMK